MNKCDYHHLNHVKEQHKSKKTLWFTLIITLFFTVMEIVGGLLSNSLALLSDSAHMISDVLALGMSMTAIYMATRNPNKKYTFGFLRFEIIASFINGLALAVIALGIFIEGIKRVMNPREVDLQLMLIIASIGLLVNIILTFVLSRSLKEEENLNIKSALWHFLGDLLSSVGIIISAILIYFTGLSILDPLISMIIGGIIFTGGAKIIHESYLILMESVPGKFDLDSVRHDIRTVEGVVDVHEMHLWAVTTDHYSLTAHVFIREDSQPLSTISTINRLLKDKYGLEHSTIQIEHPAINDHGLYGEGMLLKKQAYSS
ncbi:cation diffusion facilitator family transporter [Neobacillus sp. PS3-40]|uniref:cation diffusion facilitator family transporter n=1 Tax=Neobacillus sp. PS3-40 TaxID=3070679 RepID=UPI0027E097F2|nr:cation diffusion facilitator family transporter [Neobacillus sp. PS3-40]WML46036.1 cation diffusion facilitator family transporter [Neobacillus sp. PS3-40]